VTGYDIIHEKVRVAGISTFTQAAVAYVPLHFYTFRRRGKPVDRYTWYLGVLYLLVTVRAFVFSERLALIEMALPAVLMYLRFRRVQRFSTLLWLGPFAAIGGLVLLFLVNEYPRSWESYYINVYDNYFDFAVDRLGLYYSTALNNGAGMLSVLGWGTGDPIFTLDWLIHFPVIGEMFQIFPGGDELYQRFMDGWADPEFNSPSGIFVHFYEFGWFALLIAAFIGWIFRNGYRGWRSGSGFWCCAHAVLMVSLFELIRIPFLFSGRNLVPIALLAFAFGFLRQPAAPRDAQSRQPAAQVWR
jgi:oligosaccharide repeat unit polymerase